MIDITELEVMSTEFDVMNTELELRGYVTVEIADTDNRGMYCCAYRKKDERQCNY